MPTVLIHPPKSPARMVKRDSHIPPLLNTPSGLALLEIQGSVNATMAPEPSTDGSGRSATPIGRLVFPLYDSRKPADDTTWHKRVHLYVGKHQRLTGEVKKLANPIAVIRRKQPGISNLNDDSLGSDIQPADELEIAEIVRFKLLFAQRPEPVGGVSDGAV